ncbi:hypothetical protein Pint_12653 [Pistacia integerrima]|uniref:Uncharacterized protein n=1 Tax=Pistacia integerrima TaxID=434235 RepID=A0ACC0Y956_9ROSI|nr:hypothetical protein Pint_12653 [Pistacia integerrima]
MVKALAVASSSPGRMNFMRIMPSSSRPNYLLNLKLKPTGAALCAPAPLSQEVGYVLCSKCKVFKCVTFPNYDDGEDLVL